MTQVINQHLLREAESIPLDDLFLRIDPGDYSGSGNLLDSSGQGNDLTLFGDANVSGGAINLDGVGDYAANAELAGRLTEASFSVHILTDAIGSGPYPQIAIAYRDTSVQLLQLTFQSGNVLFQSRRSGNQLSTVSSAFPSSGWHQFGGTHSPGQNRLYIDGVKVAEDLKTVQTGVLESTKIAVGAELYSTRFFAHIDIDLVRCYGSKLSDSDMQRLHLER